MPKLFDYTHEYVGVVPAMRYCFEIGNGTTKQELWELEGGKWQLAIVNNGEESHSIDTEKENAEAIINFWKRLVAEA